MEPVKPPAANRVIVDSSLAERLLDEDREEVRIRIESGEIYSWDYSERMEDVGDG